MRFVDLFAGIGGFHKALAGLGHECVFASEIDDELRTLYKTNFPRAADHVYGDIRETKHLVPDHEILCAGFPCQPFSKSGEQRGFADQTSGTLFHEIIEIARARTPDLIILENVGNFARHDHGKTWEIVRGSLEELGYDVRGTEPRVMGGHGLVSPHHFGHPHHRERFFVVAALWNLPDDPFPKPRRDSTPHLERVVLPQRRLSKSEIRETALSQQQVDAIDHWNTFLGNVPADMSLPSFPIWSDEFGAIYPFEDSAPLTLDPDVLAAALRVRANGDSGEWREKLRMHLPSYARQDSGSFPDWKRRFIRQNRTFYEEVGGALPKGWLSTLRRQFPPSLRKLEWNCSGELRDLWSCVLQFRPSGIRAKRYTSIPALVAMTTTQIPILGPERRYLSRREALALLGFPRGLRLPSSHSKAFRALGNSVHVDVVRRVLRAALRTAKGVTLGSR